MGSQRGTPSSREHGWRIIKMNAGATEQRKNKKFFDTKVLKQRSEDQS